MDKIHKIAYDFYPVEVGPAVTDENKMVPLIDHKRNALWGLGVGGTAAMLYYTIASIRERNKSKKKNKVDPRKTATSRLVNSLLVGGAAGLATYAAMSIYQNIRGTDFSHDYKVPDLKPGQKPDFSIHFSGSNGGPWQNNPNNKLPDGSPMINWDVMGAEYEYGKNRTAHIGAFDTDYAKKYIKQIVSKHPNARIRLSGHSMGGTTAYNIAQWAAKEGINIDRLDTYDPVSRFTTFRGKPATTRLWANYRPDKVEPFKVFSILKDSIIAGKLDAKLSPAMSDFYSWVGGMHGKLDGSKDIVVSNPNINNHRMIRFAPKYYEGEEYSDYPVTLMQNIIEHKIEGNRQ